MRRVLVLSLPIVLVGVLAACQHDGRTLREPRPDQTASISTSSSVGPGFDIPGAEDIDPELTVPLDTLSVTAPWRDGAPIDARYSCDGPNVAPALSWSPAPTGTSEIAITMVDLDLPAFAHWVIAGIDPSATALGEDTVPLGAVEALNGVGDLGWTGPCPPSGSTHTYLITVHYLGDQSGLDDGSDATDMSTRIAELTLASAEVSGTYSRP